MYNQGTVAGLMFLSFFLGMGCGAGIWWIIQNSWRKKDLTLDTGGLRERIRELDYLLDRLRAFSVHIGMGDSPDWIERLAAHADLFREAWEKHVKIPMQAMSRTLDPSSIQKKPRKNQGQKSKQIVVSTRKIFLPKTNEPGREVLSVWALNRDKIISKYRKEFPKVYLKKNGGLFIRGSDKHRVISPGDVMSEKEYQEWLTIIRAAGDRLHKIMVEHRERKITTPPAQERITQPNEWSGVDTEKI